MLKLKYKSKEIGMQNRRDHEREVEKVESIKRPITYIMSSRKIHTREKEKEERKMFSKEQT